ncbi:hypothetical protein B0H11DRAFT_949473 [Mycena galericulata]|nr:hypothetical protein B0H11DRAFT_949473 [Mycena galericulata]
MMITTRKAYELVYDSLSRPLEPCFLLFTIPDHQRSRGRCSWDRLHPPIVMLTLSSSCHRQILTSRSLPSSRSRVLGLRYVLLRPSPYACPFAQPLAAHSILTRPSTPRLRLLMHLASSALPAFVVLIALVAFIAFFTCSSAAGPSVFQVPRVTVSAVGYHIPRAGVL